VNESSPRLHNYTYAEYVAIEIDSTTKHEFLDGEIYAMGGGSGEHAALALRVGRAIENAIEDLPCRAYSSDLRIYVEEARFAAFPDVSVICGPLQQHVPSPETTALNPIVVVEVTSPSSEAYDIGKKLDCYRKIPTLREYVIVSHRERRMTVHVRDENGAWTTQVAIRGGSVKLPSLGIELSVDDIYRKSTISAD
jgi:Uma2 family endonuclease